MSYPIDEQGLPEPFSPYDRFDRPMPPPPRPKFGGRIWLHVLLLLLAIGTTTIAGAFHYAAFAEEFGRRVIQYDLHLLLQGCWYSGTLIAILGAHEMGHYLYCRRYDVDATWPYFIPMPPGFFLTGTLGAVIKIREAFPDRKVLFEIGIAGPIAGFVVLVPALFLGLKLSYLIPAPTEGTVLALGEPLLFRWATEVMFGTIAHGYTVNMHPMVFAAWFGMLATSLNLLPFGQLDGGHITYASLGRLAAPISLATVSACVIMTFLSTSWLFMTVMMLVMLFTLGPRHPRVLDEREPLGPGRIALAVFALIMLILCFTPAPIEIMDLVGR